MGSQEDAKRQRTGSRIASGMTGGKAGKRKKLGRCEDEKMG
jgi:hypothetical protein